MITRGLFIRAVMAVVIVASSDVLGAGPCTVEETSRLFDEVEKAIEGNRSTEVEEAETAADIVRDCRDELANILPPDAVIRILKWIRSSNASIRKSGWRIMERFTTIEQYRNEAMELGLVDVIWSSFEMDTGDEELYILDTMKSLFFNNVFNNIYNSRNNNEILINNIIPILESRLSHKNNKIAQKAAEYLYDFMGYRLDKMRPMWQYLVESGVAGRVIGQIGTRPGSDKEFDLYLLYTVLFIVSKMEDQSKIDIARLGILPRINESLNNHKGSKGDTNSILETSLNVMSNLVAGSVEATDLLIEQGLPELVKKGCVSGFHDPVNAILEDIAKLNKPEQMKPFRDMRPIFENLSIFLHPNSPKLDDTELDPYSEYLRRY